MIGNRRHRLSIQTKVIPEAQDDYGAPIEDWTTLPAVTVQGAFEPIGTREFPSFQKVSAQTTARFRIPSPNFVIDADKNRIVMITNYSSSPIGVSIWDIHGSFPVNGKPYEILIEVSETK